MKRNKPAKRRDRKTGESPYAKHKKTPYRYSTAYHEWRSRTLRRAGREVEARR